MSIVFDVGNTETTIGLFDGDTLRADWRIMTAVPRTSNEFGIVLRSLLSASNVELGAVTAAAIGSSTRSPRANSINATRSASISARQPPSIVSRPRGSPLRRGGRHRRHGAPHQSRMARTRGATRRGQGRFGRNAAAMVFGVRSHRTDAHTSGIAAGLRPAGSAVSSNFRIVNTAYMADTTIGMLPFCSIQCRYGSNLHSVNAFIA